MPMPKYFNACRRVIRRGVPAAEVVLLSIIVILRFSGANVAFFIELRTTPVLSFHKKQPLAAENARQLKNVAYFCSMKSILGLGNALVDVLALLHDDDLLTTFRLPKGSMQHVDEPTGNRIWEHLRPLGVRYVAGGSASNTLTGAAQLGMRCAFIGKTGRDELGALFAASQTSQGIAPTLLESPTATGRCMVFISPDTERTMATYLGAAIELTADDLQPEMFDGFDYFHIEGYLVQNHALVRRAVELAKAQKMTVSLDLASYNVVDENRQFLLDVVQNSVDIVFANEAEAETFTGQPPAEALATLSGYCPIAVVKIGSAGSLVQSGNRRYTIAACPARALDATGAGDLYAAGFLYAHSQGYPLERCGAAASAVAAKVVEVVGSHLDSSVWRQLKKELTN
jgi:sugar/nucleoside kinase (ribokinase family)